jgi:hypothetical protein
MTSALDHILRSREMTGVLGPVNASVFSYELRMCVWQVLDCSRLKIAPKCSKLVQVATPKAVLGFRSGIRVGLMRSNEPVAE